MSVTSQGWWIAECSLRKAQRPSRNASMSFIWADGCDYPLSPDEIAIEDPFVARNVRSALAIGRAQAIAMLAAAGHGISVATYPPAKVKHGVADYGRGDKEQVQRMVCIQLGLSHSPGQATPPMPWQWLFATCERSSCRAFWRGVNRET